MSAPASMLATQTSDVIWCSFLIPSSIMIAISWLMDSASSFSSYILWIRVESTFERFVSCPVLEDLEIHVRWKDSKVYRVQSRSLTKLYLVWNPPMVGSFVLRVVIDASLLCYLRVYDRVSEFYRINNLECNAKLDIHLDFDSNGFSESRV